MTKALSVITSVLNGRPYIEDMLASMPFEAPIEHLVIDAGSTDGTIDLLQHRAELRLIVRPQLSLYAAWNEALTLAEGNYVLFLNADDLLAAGAIARIMPLLDGTVDIVCGEADVFRDKHNGGSEITCHYRGPELTGLALDALVFGAPIINAKVFRRALLLQRGGFDESFRFAADRKLMLRLIGTPLNVRYFSQLLYRYRIHAGSKTLQQTPQRRILTAREHRCIATQMLQASAAGQPAREMMQAWHAHETAVLLTRGLTAGDCGAVREAAVDLLRGGVAGLMAIATARRVRRAYAERLRMAGMQGGELPT